MWPFVWRKMRADTEGSTVTQRLKALADRREECEKLARDRTRQTLQRSRSIRAIVASWLEHTASVLEDRFNPTIGLAFLYSIISRLHPLWRHLNRHGNRRRLHQVVSGYDASPSTSPPRFRRALWRSCRGTMRSELCVRSGEQK